MNRPLVVIAGPTACGKTALSIKLAKKINAEIISADSMQVYKYMDIGTAKPSAAEMDGIKHYLINELTPDCEYSVAVFKKKAAEYINRIYEKGKTPILVGGTGFYINSVVYNNDFTETAADNSYRSELQKTADDKGALFLHNMLREIDAAAADNIHQNNVKRVIRALEYYRQTGKPISAHNEIEKARTPYYDTAFIILNMERPLLYDRIDLRVDKMLEDGLVDEVAFLYEKYGEALVSMQGLGYKEIIPYLKGEVSLDSAVRVLKQRTRHFVKRQLTWFKHQTDGVWLDAFDEALLDKCVSLVDMVLD